MTAPLLYDIVESPAHPDLGTLADDLGLELGDLCGQNRALLVLVREVDVDLRHQPRVDVLR